MARGRFAHSPRRARDGAAASGGPEQTNDLDADPLRRPAQPGHFQKRPFVTAVNLAPAYENPRHPPNEAGSLTSPLLKSTYCSVKSAAYITAPALPRLRRMCRSNSFGATAAHRALKLAAA